MAPPRARRSELATPASSEKMCAKAPGSGADLVFLDLEDACAPVAKEGARSIAVAALTEQDWGRTVRAVRVNGLDTPWCYGDVIEIVTGAREALDVIIVPKARTARDVWWCEVGAFTVLKALAFRGRGENKDAYDLVYMLQNYGAGIDDVFRRLRPLLENRSTQQALDILQQDFTAVDSVGTMRAAEFVGDPQDEAGRADSAGAVRSLLELCRRAT
jgi:hypothetical protein